MRRRKSSSLRSSPRQFRIDPVAQRMHVHTRYRRRATLIPLLLFLVKIYYGTPLPLFRPAYSGGLSQAQ